MLPKQNVLVTGGAGFIGSNLVERLLMLPNVGKVRVLDNLSTGFRDNFQEFLVNPNFEFVEGDIRDYDTCLAACRDIDLISHQAALGSVPRSIADPLTTNAVNITGTLNVFTAAKNAGIKRIVYAASSSTYGDSAALPKVENSIGNPLSPYAVTKLVNELYARVYADLYGVKFVGLRYFNVFGPKQSPTGQYAAVVPIFVNALLDHRQPTINGDGTRSRDFTFVENAVEANVLALFTDNDAALNEVYNVACGEQTTLNKMFEILKSAAASDIEPIHGQPRMGDIPHSWADVSKAENLLGYVPKVLVEEGLKRTFDWYKNQLKINPDTSGRN